MIISFTRIGAVSVPDTWLRLAFSLLLALVVVSCGSGESSPTDGGSPATAVATTVTLSPTALGLQVGQTGQVSASVLDQTGAVMSGAPINWQPTTSSVATVSSTGLVTALDEGVVTVSATSGSASASLAVTVTAAGPAPVAPTANFSVSSPGGQTPVSVTFTDTSSPGSASITSWVWDFGDGTSGSGPVVTHVFSTDAAHASDPQFFDVRLTVTTSVGSDTKRVDRGVEAYELTYSEGGDILLPSVSSYSSQIPTQSQLQEIDLRPLGTFRPNIARANLVSWGGRSPGDTCDPSDPFPRFAPPASPVPTMRTSVPTVSDVDLAWESPVGRSQQTHPDDRRNAPWNFPMRFTLTWEGAAVGGSTRWQTCDEVQIIFPPEQVTDWVSAYNVPIGDLPYVRHQKYWTLVENQPLGTTNLFSQGRSFEFGIEETAAYEMSASVTATSGLQVGAATASLSATLTATFSRSTTVSVVDRVENTYTAPAHKPNYNLRYTLWQEVDVFEITGADRSRWSSPHYDLVDADGQLLLVHPTGRVVALSQWFRVGT